MHTEACTAVELNRRGAVDRPASCPYRGESQCYGNSDAIQNCILLTGAWKLWFSKADQVVVVPSFRASCVLLTDVTVFNRST